ncbi:N5-glutamine methyltransferase family protein [Mangrovihabitans endophyticus]|uniref:Release factor glutamine methyltransferase n=1 Tax=Mangrovihabitans endophyticus TaxID=1751298 RepID=A0A8J3C3C6_9ACTN|nr:HemK/PrmC family methyltransferase [Mangrovihabitans endophyticus]GGL01143.1 release factor glutamine methyltransferase [Mangrovihabitans endophyticus]
MEHIGTLIDSAVGPIAIGNSPTPHRDADELYAHLLGVSVEEIDRNADADPQTAARYRQLVDERASGVPMAHLLGAALFDGLRLSAGPGVFTPRRDFSQAVDATTDAVRDTTAPIVVDLCAGCAAMALAIAHRRPDAQVHAVELDEEALHFAAANRDARAAAGDTTITVHHGDVTKPDTLSTLDGRVDAVVANPPFVPDEVQLPAEFSVHQPRDAVYAGPDGLDVIRPLLDTAARLLRADGTLVLEHGHLHGETVPAMLSGDDRFTGVRTHQDQYGYPLYTVARRAA